MRVSGEHVALSLTYTELLPPSDLAPWVACFWQIAGAGVGDSVLHRVLPDGCADLLLDLDGCRRAGRASVKVVGPMSTAQVFKLQGARDTVGVRLRPGAIRAFGGVPANLLLDTIIPVSELRAAPRINIEQVADLARFPARAQVLVDACRARLAALPRPDPVVSHALATWLSPERTSFPRVSVLTRDLGLSERAFERRFLAQVGLTPVGYRRLARFRAALRLHASGIHDWAQLAASTGFSDQPHLVRDFRELAGLSPTEWAASQASPAGFLQDGHVTRL
jgi:AraC-like DNA-binding protein